MGLSSDWPDDVRFVTATSEVRVKTVDARRVLAVRAIARGCGVQPSAGGAAAAGDSDGPSDVLSEALGDRWHQPYRAPLVPGLSEALTLKHPSLLGVCLSGSGPTVAALCTGDTAGVEEALTGIYSRLGLACRVRTLAAHNGPPRAIEQS